MPTGTAEFDDPVELVRRRGIDYDALKARALTLKPKEGEMR